MILVKVGFTHYSPKDSESGIAEYVLADTLDQAVAHIDDKHMFGWLKDAEADGDEGSYSPDEDWLTADRRAEATAAGLSVDEYGSVCGPAHTLTRWLGGTFWKDTDDAYYGVTHYDWRQCRVVDEADAAVLVRLGLVIDIRGRTDPAVRAD